MNRFVPDRGLDRDLAALVGLGLPTPEGFRGPGVKLRDWLACRACGKRGTTLHHTVPNWICRATGAKEVLESLCPECHSAAEKVAWEASEHALRRADLLGLTLKRDAKLKSAIETWNEWVRWNRRKHNLELAGRNTAEASSQEQLARKRLGPVRERLRVALRKTAAAICLQRIDYAGMVPAWRKGGVTSLDPIRFVT